MNLLLWGGPVFAPGAGGGSSGDIGKVAWHTPTEVLTVNHGPDGGFSSTAFSQLAATYRGPDGRILQNLLAAHGLDVSQYERIAISGFSAFHGLANPLLDADGDLISAAVLFDSCFETPGSPPKAGYRSFAELAARGNRLMVFCSSSGQNGPGLPPTTTGWECAENAAGAGADDAGVALEESAGPDGVTAPKCGARRAGNLWLLNYCDQFYPDMHGGIVKLLPVEVLNALLVPYMAGESSELYDSPSSLPRWALPAGAAALAIVLGLFLASRKP